MIKKPFTFVGGRIIKTGIAVFVTALICHLLQWPAIFAVITAIVTIEPTVADSIKKAFVRFPAAVIGAALAVSFTFLLGETPFTYALVAFTTIIACHKLKLHEGTLVATLTGVAMISTVHDHYIASLFIRLGTTTTGLLVSTLVNFFILPPNYSKTISSEIQQLFGETGQLIQQRGQEWFHHHSGDKKLRQEFQDLLRKIEKVDTICRYQKNEWKYHRVNRKDIRLFHYEYKKLILLRQFAFHTGNLMYIPVTRLRLETEQLATIEYAIQSIKHTLASPTFSCDQDFHSCIEKINHIFTYSNLTNSLDEPSSDGYHHITPETSILYELLALYDLIDELCKIQSLETKYIKQHN
ncbi:aromatic acid exporter family protein [Bacillus pinisoli]|uniref:aromatic acid exporter family protein n=1 Tax=Bacillus pinisoli TaxID=2901866 RepID=UPI001FF454E5|nr:aromatic acid exporter family protein [Bacillus pinisoli]